MKARWRDRKILQRQRRALEYNNWEVDGGDTLDNGSNNTLNVTPSIDAIAEVKVLTSNYGAQYGTKVPARSRLKPNLEPMSSTATSTNSCATTISISWLTRTVSRRTTKKRFWLHHRRSGLYSRASTTRTSKRRFFSGRRSGVATGFPILSTKPYRLSLSVPAISAINAPTRYSVGLYGRLPDGPKRGALHAEYFRGHRVIAANQPTRKALLSNLVPAAERLGTPQGGAPGQDSFYQVDSQPTNWRENWSGWTTISLTMSGSPSTTSTIHGTSCRKLPCGQMPEVFQPSSLVLKAQE